MKDDALYVAHILECIRRIEENVASGKETFMQSHVLQDATVRNLQTMAESTQRLSQGVRGAYPNVGWRELSGFRNVLVHNYFGVNLERIWEIIHGNLPILKEAVVDLARHTPPPDLADEQS
jgi:uncharacterized protein with HEPN domain